jgi:predicted nuclease of predicted toxin-antitoxin system
MEEERGIGDPRVLAEALEQERILLTCDKDFGELVSGRASKRAAE